METMEFSIFDVRAVASALLENHAWFDDSDYGFNQYICDYCGARSKKLATIDDIDKIKHDLNCPVLIARDLLTRI